ncbi:MAG: DUF1801 domain-containing protein [Longimicrobiales bacterium]
MKANKAVAAWLDSYDNPMKDVVSRVRDTVLHADARIKESIKRKAPTFSYRGTLVSVFPESKKHASLMFERGAEIPGHHPRLEGSGDTGRVMKVHTVAEAHAVKDDLQHLVRSWCDWRDAEAAKEAEAEARAARKPVAKRKVARRKKVAGPAAKKVPARKKVAKPGAKSAAKKVTARKSAARPAATKARRRAGPRAS